MEPRSIDRGKPRGHPQGPGPSDAASMEPRSIDRGKPDEFDPLVFESLPLQWSRDQLIAERWELHDVIRQGGFASMEPRSIDRGKQSNLATLIGDGKLQWSRDQLIAESVMSEPIVEQIMTLQWSRDQLIAERLGLLTLRFAKLSFNGAAIN